MKLWLRDKQGITVKANVPVAIKTPQQKRKKLMIELFKILLLYIAFSPLVAKPFYDYMLFRPDKGSYSNLTVQVSKQLKDELNVETKNLTITARNGNKLSARYFVRLGAQQTVIVSHGNAGNIDHRSVLAAALLCCNLNVLLYDYEGYGASEGTPSIKAMVSDGLVAYDYVRDTLKVEPKNIIVYGESIGSGVTTQIASKRAVSGIVLQSGFSTLFNASKDFLYYLPIYPVSWFENLDNIEILKAKHAPLLIVHGDKDNVIGVYQARDLYRQAAEPKTYVEFKNFGHMLEQIDRLDYLNTIKKFASSLKTG